MMECGRAVSELWDHGGLRSGASVVRHELPVGPPELGMKTRVHGQSMVVYE